MYKLKQIEKIYKEIAEEDKKLSEDFLSISLETMEGLTFKMVIPKIKVILSWR